MNGIKSEIVIAEQLNNQYNVNLPKWISEYAPAYCASFTGYDDNHAAAFLIYKWIENNKRYTKPAFRAPELLHKMGENTRYDTTGITNIFNHAVMFYTLMYLI